MSSIYGDDCDYTGLWHLRFTARDMESIYGHSIKACYYTQSQKSGSSIHLNTAILDTDGMDVSYIRQKLIGFIYSVGT